MNIIFAALTATTLYLLCTLGLLLRLRQHPISKDLSKASLLAPGFLALAAHGYILFTVMITPVGINLGFYTSLSLISACISLLILFSSLRHPVEILGIIIMPLTALMIIMDALQTSSHLIATGSSNGLLFHIMSSLVAYSILGLAAAYAIVLSIQNSLLHRHQPSGFIRFLPPLHDMETLLFQFLGFGFLCLSASLLTGFVYLEDIFARHLVRMTVLSIVGWVIRGVLLFGRLKFGCRGKTAIRWTLSAFAFLMLAYFGSKLVLEFIL